jgi:RNA polymerase sigma factor (sigma-70 family)
MMASFSEDRRLAERLRAQDGQAVAELMPRCAVPLRQAWSELQRELPTLRSSLDNLLPSAGRAIGMAYLACPAEDEESLAGFAARLHLKDLLLVAGFLAGDPEAVGRVQEIIHAQVRPILFKRLSGKCPPDLLNDSLAELAGHHFEIIGKGEHKGQQRLATFTGRSRLDTWLFATARNLVLNKLRTRSRGPTLMSGQEALLATGKVDASPSQALLNHEAEQRGKHLREQLVLRLQQALREMPERRRLVAVLRWVQGLPPSQIAERLGVSRPAVSEQLHRACEQFEQAVGAIAREIATEANRKPADIMTLLLDQLGELLGRPLACPEGRP